MDNFTPVSAAAGGALIGLSAVLLMWLNGRIAGVSGIFSGALFGGADDRLWRLTFIVGIAVGSALAWLFLGEPFAPRSGFPVPATIVAGLLVGFGTALGSGCTSGHGICGIARLSPRSILATATFLLAAIATSWIVRQGAGLLS
jgi:uncharacterized membrane protein YedE/YeeE